MTPLLRMLVWMVLLREVIEHPGIYLHEMQDELFHTTGVEYLFPVYADF